jgi:integrase/recombinase XerD
MTEEFIRQRQYLVGVTPRTIVWYRCTFKAFKGALESREAAQERIVELRKRNVSAITINSYLRCVNAYFQWLHVEHGREAVRIPKLREEQKVLATLSPEQVRRIVQAKPTNAQTHTACLVMLDTGLRMSECLGLRKTDLDFDNLVIRVQGKGNKQRLVPMSHTLRGVLYRHCRGQKHDLVSSTRNGTPFEPRNFHRYMRLLGDSVGITGVRFSPHTLSHTFAASYLRNGGNLFYLSKILGHTSVKTTERYLQSLGVDDLQAVHDKLSLLTKRG